MSITDRFWDATAQEQKSGFTEDTKDYICLLCGKKIEKGIIYQDAHRLIEARTAMILHIEKAHSSVFEFLNGLDKRLTGLSDHQSKLMQLFYQGRNDNEVQKELSIGSVSTIRNHRFALKEKERQSKVFLVMMELLKEKNKSVVPERPPHPEAKMVDDRYNISQEEQAKILKKYFLQGPTGPLKTFAMKEKSKIVVLREVSKRFEKARIYTEKELNEILKEVYSEDYVAIRRYLIEYGFMNRKTDCSAYWLKEEGGSCEQR